MQMTGFFLVYWKAGRAQGLHISLQTSLQI